MSSVMVNGAQQWIEADPDMPLLWVLRDVLKLKGTKYGCGVGICGVCTVLIDGEPQHACMVPLQKAAGRNITTIEGLRGDPQPRLLRAWLEESAPQCGYCHPSQFLLATALLDRNPNPTDKQIAWAMDGVLCRCGSYQRIRRAIQAAAAEPGSRPEQDAVLAKPVIAEFDTGVALNEWISIRPDNAVVIMINFSEMGQGVLTSLAMLIAEELEVDLAQIRVEFAPAGDEYVNTVLGGQVTGGSTAIRASWKPLREAGASARERLIQAAMQRWDVERAECRAARGAVVHEPSGRRLPYAELATTAQSLPRRKRVALKSASEFRLIGRPHSRLDAREMIEGVAEYAIDISVRDMVVAAISRPPTVGGRLERFDATRTLETPGVHEVVEIDQSVAVIASDSWSALRGRECLAVEWDAGPHAELDTAALYASLDAALREPGIVATRRGNAQDALRHAETVIRARYRTPYLAHCTMEPMNSIADVRRDACDIWVGTQAQSATRDAAAELTGLRNDKIHVHTTFLGGGFGRRLATDFVAEAVRLSSKLERPVQVIWTRDDDLRHDRFRPAHCVQLKAALDENGLPAVWWQRLAGPPLALEMNEVPYAIPSYCEEHVEVSSILPINPWRGVGATQNAFIVESFIDELAHHAGRDPLEYRLALLTDAPRHAAVLMFAAEKAQWGKPLPKGRHRGIAAYHSFGSWVAEVAEVSITRENTIRVHRVVCAIDCGQTVNPDTIRAQLEGAIAFGLSAALKEEVRVSNGRIQQANFEDYPILRHAEMPEVEVHIAENRRAPGGVGEPGVPVIAPAVANAVFVATGQRLRSLPLQLD